MGVPCHVFDEIVREPEVGAALDDLDIDPDDHMYLSDILDPDLGGSITIFDFMDGIKRLRGQPRRSDIVTVDLMVRSTQRKVEELSKLILSNGRQSVRNNSPLGV